MYFLIPWLPGGMLMQKVNARTWGYLVVVACALFLLYYSFQIQWSWWMAQEVVKNANLVYQQVLIGIIGFIVIPALLWTPVTSEELVEQVRQAHLVKRYELQTQADIAILRATLLRAREKALIGFANLTLDEREELAGVMRGLVSGIDRTLQEIGASVKTVSGATIPFHALEDNDDIRDVLDYISESLVKTSFKDDQAHDVPAALDDAEAAQEVPQRGRGRYTDPRLTAAAEAVRLTRTPETVDIKTKRGVMPFDVVAWHDDGVTIDTEDGPKRLGSEKIAR